MPLEVCGSCNNDQVPIGFRLKYGKYYKLFDKSNFKNARQVCQDNGGAHLAMAKEDDDFKAINHYFSCESDH